MRELIESIVRDMEKIKDQDYKNLSAACWIALCTEAIGEDDMEALGKKATRVAKIGFLMGIMKGIA